MMTVNAYLLSLHSPVAVVNKFTCQKTFRQALYKALFAHLTATSSTTAAVAVTAVAITAAAAATPDLVHSRVKMKRGTCVICKEHTAKERRLKKRQKRQGLQDISPNITSKRKDDRVNRTDSGCDLCDVHLCHQRSGRVCWQQFHK